jgi:hypothetical protein
VEHISLDQLVDEGFPTLRSGEAMKLIVDLPGSE